MSAPPLRVETRDHVAILTLDRPAKLNALDASLRDAMLAAIDDVRADDTVRAVVFTGAGRGFCSGADLTAAASSKPPTQNDNLDDLGWVGRQALALHQLDKPTIAAVNGVAAGAGMSLALACDLRVGSPQSRFKTVFIERNLSPDSGMSFFLPRIVGYSRAADLIYTSRAVAAEEAHRIGLLDRLVPHEDLLDAAVALAAEMTAWPPLALRVSKRVLQHNAECGLPEALRFELANLAVGNRAVNDRKESMAAFAERRKPVFTGT